MPVVEKVKVTLGSMPAGAVMLVEGMGQVCSNAPCEVLLVPDSPVTVTARLGDVEKEMIFTPSQQNTDVLLELELPGNKQPEEKKPKAAKGKSRSRTSGSSSSGSPSGTGGLKIPDVFKNN